MSPASLAFAHRPHPDHARIAALSAAIAVNLAVMLIATRPITPNLLHVMETLSPVPTIRIITPKPIVPPPKPIEMEPLPAPVTPPAPVHHTLTPPVSAPAVVPTNEGTIAVPPVTTPTLLPASTTPLPTSTAEPVEASLAYLAAPLTFPTRALQQRMQGTVVLRVLVDETGKPVRVTVEHGSGYALLDRSAVQQVMAGWQFQPAMVDGRAVSAWAKVPVTFRLRE